MLLFCDLETFSPVPISCGAHAYAAGDGARILLWGFAIDDAPARVWQVGHEPMPEDLKAAIETVRSDPEARHVWHNGINFDTVFIEKTMPECALPLERIEDTMLIAFQHGLPGSLADLSVVFKLAEDKAKDRDGARLIRLFCAPRPDNEGKPFTKDDHPEDWEKFVNYCRLDVEAERELYRRLPKVNCNGDRELMLLDARINRRGMLMDVELAKAAVAATEAEQQRRRGRTAELTQGELESTTRTKATIDFIKETWGVELANMRKGELERLCENEDLPEPMRELLRIRLGSARSSTKKFQALLNAVGADGRLRGCLQFRGAGRTGRFAGRLFQPQNLPRPTMSNGAIEEAIADLKSGAADLIYPDVGAVAASCLRGTIVVPKGKRMAVADYSNIEGRVLAWLAGEQWKLSAFREYDTLIARDGSCIPPEERYIRRHEIKLNDKGEPIHVGHDLYKLTYAKAFNVDVEKVTKAQRQMGKVLELAMGYGGGVGAFVTFARGYGIDLKEMAEAVLPTIPAGIREQAEKGFEWAAQAGKVPDGMSRTVWVACDSVKRLWRRANPNIVKLWAAFDDAVANAFGGMRGAAAAGGKVRVWVSKGWLMMKLPSGRYLCYPGARFDEEGCTFSYMGVHQVSRRWMRLKTYAGKITENATQAVACDVLTNALFYVESAGFDPILTVHDEILTEAPDDEAHDAFALEHAMEVGPLWADDLPLAAAGFTAYRYRK